MRTLAFLSCAVLCACQQNPDEILPIHGRVSSRAAPVAGQSVQLLRRVRASGDYRTPCTSEELLPFKEALVDDDGGYRFQVFRAEGQSLSPGTEICFRVETTFASGSRASSEPSGLLFDTPIATLRDWPSTPTLDAGIVVFEPVVPLPPDSFLPFEPRPTLDELGTQLEHALSFENDSGVIWRMNDSRTQLSDGGAFLFHVPLVLDDTRVEDFSGFARVTATLTDFTERTQYLFYDSTLGPVRLRPPSDPFVTGTFVPPSRGLPCPPFDSPCPFTDGALEVVDGGLASSLSLELVPPRDVRLLVLRDVALYSAALDVELTLEDGGLWSLRDDSRVGLIGQPFSMRLPDGGYANLATSYRAITLDAGAPAHIVTLKFPNGLVWLRELSVF